MTPAQREAKKAYQRAWHAKRYAEIMANPESRAAENRRKREWERRTQELTAAPAIDSALHRAHGPFAALFSSP